MSPYTAWQICHSGVLESFIRGCHPAFLTAEAADLPNIGCMRTWLGQFVIRESVTQLSQSIWPPLQALTRSCCKESVGKLGDEPCVNGDGEHLFVTHLSNSTAPFNVGSQAPGPCCHPGDVGKGLCVALLWGPGFWASYNDDRWNWQNTKEDHMSGEKGDFLFPPMSLAVQHLTDTNLLLQKSQFSHMLNSHNLH